MAETSRVWLVTGTSSGLGLALVQAILAAGDRVVATLRKPSTLSSLVAAHPSDKLLVMQMDVTNQKHINATFSRIKEHFGRLDVVVNNAGYAVIGEVESISDEQARHQMEVNFWGPVIISRKAVQFFREENPVNAGGRIMNISSIAGYFGSPTLGMYSASKFALEGFTESLAKEVPAKWNIKITIILPAGVRTNWNKSSMVTLPIHPAYNEPDSPSNAFRPALQAPDFFTNDPVKAANALIKLSRESKPPMRLGLGEYALHVVRTECEADLKESNEWAELSRSTEASDVKA